MITSKPIVENLNDLRRLFDGVATAWVNVHGDNAVRQNLENLIPKIQEKKINGIVIYDGVGAPIGFAWEELTSPYYGSMAFYVSKDRLGSQTVWTQSELVKQFLKAGFCRNKLLEVFSFNPDDTSYDNYLIQEGLFMNTRQRMGMYLSEYDDFFVPNLPEGFELKRYTEDYKYQVAEASYYAHKFSKDQEAYEELKSIEKRRHLEDRIWTDHYGPVIRESNFIILHEDKVVGSIVNVEIKCWGSEKVPWVFDIGVHPDFMGKKLGRILFASSLHSLKAAGYDVMGLGVTQSNTNAIRLYESYGFQVTEVFREFSDAI